MKRILINLTGGKNVNLFEHGIKARSIETVWTVYDEDMMWANCRPDENGITAEKGDLEHLNPTHHKGAFFEEKIHDWDVDKNSNTLRYYGIYEDKLPDGNVKILLICKED